MKPLLILLVSTTVLVGMATAQTAPARPRPQGDQSAPSTPPPPRPPAGPASQRAQTSPEPPLPPPAAVNVRIQVAIIDEGGPQTMRENVTLTTTDRQEASFRSNSEVQVASSAPFPTSQTSPVVLNVDATPQVSGLPAGKIRVRVLLDYLPKWADPNQRPSRTRLQFAVVADDGKTIVASDISDPATERRVRVELTATLLK